MIKQRKATVEDAPFIASMIMAALHIDEKENERLYHHMVELVEDNGTLYSWNRCVIAEDKSDNVGLCLAYDAKDYHERRIRSFSMPCSDGKTVSEEIPSLLEQEDEAGEGEYYIDSVAVLPSHRGLGIGRQLMAEAIKTGTAMNLRPTLIVDPNNDNAVKLYYSLGFRYSKETFIFGQLYHKYNYQG